jgi:hypothetical protein
VTKKVALLDICQSQKVLGGKALLRANILSQSNLDLRQLVGVSQTSWLLSTIIDWDKMTTNDKNVLNRTNQVKANSESHKNFNVTIFLTDKEQFVQDFHGFAKKTAQSTLEMCKVVYDAKHTLTNDNFDSFCREIGQKSSDSTIRKYLAIGEKYHDFINYADRLPNSWTSIYKITQIDSTTFSALVSTDNTFATMRAKDIDLLINPNKSIQSKSTQNSSNQPTAAATAESNVIASDDLVDAQINASEADIEPQSQDDDLQDSAQDVEDSVTSDNLAETKQSKKSIKVNEIEQLSDDFHVVIKFKTQPSKAKFKEFVDLMSHLRNNSNFNLDIEMFNDEFVTDSSDINQQTLNAISKIASNSAIHTIEVVKK